MTPISALHNTETGPVALLGNGRSLASWDLDAVAEMMPLFGINRSWKLATTRWTCFVDGENDDELRTGVAPWPELVFCIEEPPGLRPSLRRISIRNAPRLPPGVERSQIVIVQQHHERRFSGLDLDRGSCGMFAGHFALEIVTWLGFNPIYLLGFDGHGARFYDPPDAPGVSAKETATWNAAFSEARVALDELGVQVWNACATAAIHAFDYGIPGVTFSGTWEGT